LQFGELELRQTNFAGTIDANVISCGSGGLPSEVSRTSSAVSRSSTRFTKRRSPNDRHTVGHNECRDLSPFGFCFLPVFSIEEAPIRK
jgi:hypothetical protein